MEIIAGIYYFYITATAFCFGTPGVYIMCQDGQDWAYTEQTDQGVMVTAYRGGKLTYEKVE